MPTIQLERALFLPFDVEVPLVCPECAADLTERGAIEEWDWTDYRLSMHFTPDGMGDCADSSSGNGTNDYHPISVGCRSCGEVLAEAGEPTKEELLAHVGAEKIVNALRVFLLDRRIRGFLDRADPKSVQQAFAALGEPIRTPHDGEIRCDCSRCCRVDPSRGATIPAPDRQAGDS